ncbi:MAG: sulfatase [Rhodopirellula sp.]|nr:sulfatase [Rhodopirellula sp.]|tara:strand:+ start:905 stop:2497 length:1593 start_codon:yes stop_codon:yes gene_type:complete
MVASSFSAIEPKMPRKFFAVLVLFLSSLVTYGDDRPNILLIMADDLGFSDIGCYGSEIPTPNLDKLANNGLRFTQFYNTSKCHSSRVSLLTGLYCDQAGGESLSRGATIAEVLKEAGYFTAMSGKWHLSKQPTDFGFDRYWGHLSGATNFFTGDDTFRYNGQKYDVPETLNGRPFYTTHAIADFAIEFINEGLDSKQPFLMYLPFNAPHYPLQAPEADVKRHLGNYNDGWDELRETRFTKQLEIGLFPASTHLSPRSDHVPAWSSLPKQDKEWEAKRMAVFAAMVDLLDQNIGRVIAHLEEKGILDNTLILFCSDNGACPFERTQGRFKDPWNPASYWLYDASWANAGNTPFRLYKQNQHEGGICSPLIAHWPKGLQTKPGEITTQTAHLVDFMATFLEVAEAKYPQQVGERKIDPLVGKSLVPVFEGAEREGHETLYFHFGTDRALRQGPWKIVSAKLGRWELYNLNKDRTEMHDLAAKHPQRVNEMKAIWFDIAANQERLKGKHLLPVKKTITKLTFRKDTSSGGVKD